MAEETPTPPLEEGTPLPPLGAPAAYEPQAGETERLKAETGRSEEDCKQALTAARGDYALASSLIGMRPAQSIKEEGEQPTPAISSGTNP